MAISIRSLIQLMNSQQQLSSVSLYTLAHYYRWPDNILPQKLSLRLLINRSLNSNGVNVRFLSYNTYLMRVDIPVGTFLDMILGVGGLLRLFKISPESIFEKRGVTGWEAVKAMKSKWEIGLVIAANPTVSLAFLSLSDAMSLFNIKAVDLVSKLFTPSGILELLGITIDIPTKSKPALETRGIELGQELANQYQIMALCEVWQQDSLNRILAGWPTPPNVMQGPQLNINDAKSETAIGSGLAVLSTFTVVETQSHVFHLKGVDRTIAGFGNLNHLVDIDSWAKKSVLLTRISVGVGIIDLYNTHLYSGGDAIEFLGWVGLSKPSDEEKHAVRIGQIQEFITFYQETHNPQNVAILTGDFNINGINSELFSDLNSKLSAVGLEELWTKAVYANPHDGGQTNRSGDPNTSFEPVCKRREQDILNPSSINENDYYCDDKQPSDFGVPGGRIDYIYVEQPTEKHSYNLEVTRLRRRPFLRNNATDGELYLSDHMGLDITLLISPKNM